MTIFDNGGIPAAAVDTPPAETTPVITVAHSVLAVSAPAAIAAIERRAETAAGISRIENWLQPESFLAPAESVITTNALGPIRLIAAFVEHLRVRSDVTRSG